MSKQYNKAIKRQRRDKYVARKKDTVKAAKAAKAAKAKPAA
jgi:hypothetical protein